MKPYSTNSVSDVVEDANTIPPQVAHIPVLPVEYIDALFNGADASYIDCTFGRGGHAQLLLDKLSAEGRLLALDRDPEAVAVGTKLAEQDSRFRMIHRPFSELADAMQDAGLSNVDAIGFDLGVSSPQIDQAHRGFSFQSEGPLDMRMNPQADTPLLALLQYTNERQLADVIRSYGDERFSMRIARAILKALAADALHNTRDLENVCFHAVPPQARHGKTHPATRTFQALRIWVNEEYSELNSALTQAVEALKPGGKLAVISFHSGEDRRVRDFIESLVHPCTCPPQFPMCVCHKTPSMRWLQKKPIRAGEAELAANPRSRSARLRVAEKIALTTSEVVI